MTRLASRRRFPDTIIRRRIAAGYRDENGEWIPGGAVDVEFAATVQPLGVADSELVGGAQLSDRRAIYIPEPQALEAAFDTQVADHVLIDGQDFVVTDSWSWRNHTKAVVLRET